MNLARGQPWLDDERISQAVGAITRIAAPRLMEANQAATELLLKGITVEGLPDWDGGRGQTDPLHRLGAPGAQHLHGDQPVPGGLPAGYDRGKEFIVPDLVLLVNGIPLVVVECKSPPCPEPMAEAVDQLRRYTNQRCAAGEVDDNEGNETPVPHQPTADRQQLRRGAVGSIGRELASTSRRGRRCWHRWPGTEADVAAALGKATLAEQERLIAGLLRAGAPAGRGAPLHAVHAGRRADDQVGLPLPAVPRGERCASRDCAAARRDARTASTTGAAA